MNFFLIQMIVGFHTMLSIMLFFCSRWKLWKYKKTFTGSELVTWLVENNICSSRDDALGYCIKLWNGQVLRHLNCTDHFQDTSNILYTFNRR